MSQAIDIRDERVELEHKYREEQLLFQEEKRIRSIWITALVITLVLILIIFFLIYRNLINKSRLSQLRNEHLSMERQILEEKLEFKNKELTTNVMYLMSKNSTKDPKRIQR